MNAHRFFNRTLRPMYAACPLQAIRPPNDPIPTPQHILPVHEYRRTELRRSRDCPWKHTRFLPPRQWTQPAGVPPLSYPFNGFDPSKPNKRRPAASRKKRKTCEGTAIGKPTCSKPTPSPPKKEIETNGQKRKKQLQLDGIVFRTAKVRMWPTAVQRKELRRCFDVCRYAYNWANECVQEGLCPPNHRVLRDKFRSLRLMQDLPYANTPGTAVSSDMVSHAIHQLTDAYASNFAKRRKDPSHRFHIDFRAKSPKKTPTEVIIIEKDRATGDYAKKQSTLLRFELCECKDRRKGRKACQAFFGNNLKNVGGIRMQDNARIINRILAEGDRLREDAQIQWNKRTGAFYFIYLYTVQKPADPDPEFMHKRIVATDPGCAPFQEWYSPTSGEFGALLEDGYPEIRKRCHIIDNLQSRLALRRNTPFRMVVTQRRQALMTTSKMKRAHRATTRRLRRKLATERRRLRGFVESAHYDAANFLFDEHDVVIVPVLQVSALVHQRHDIEAQVFFQGKLARAMYTWSHYLFRQRLLSASARYAGRHVYETTEPGTSKTCTHCGTWNRALRLGDKVFECPRCAIAVDRQLAGARNNFLAAYGMALGRHWDGVTG